VLNGSGRFCLVSGVESGGGCRLRSGILLDVVIAQRVRVRWSAASRGAAHADLRRGVGDVYELPALPEESLLVHDVLADEATGYLLEAQVLAGPDAVRAAGLWIECAGDRVVVDRLASGAAYPVRRTPARLFTLAPGQIGRYRANFRFTGCACSPRWYYEQWTIHVAFAPTRPDLFLDAQPV
jgi:hypothetical protein